MNQLELRTYLRAEIADILSVNINDSKHFKRNVENKLSKWGYGYHYETAAVKILSIPKTPEERIAEILYRGFGIDIQINAKEFACFIAAFSDIEGFNSMPWDERLKNYNSYYGYNVSDDRTLRNWCHRLLKSDIIVDSGGSTRWRTYFEGDRKIRESVEEIDETEMRSYFKRRRELFSKNYADELKDGFSPKEAKKAAWKQTYTDLWAEYECCYYFCKNFMLTAFSDNENLREIDIDVREIYELVREITQPISPPTNPNPSIPPTNEFTF